MQNSKKTLVLVSILILGIIFAAIYFLANNKAGQVNDAYTSLFDGQNSTTNASSTEDSKVVSYFSEGFGFTFDYPRAYESSFRIVSGSASTTEYGKVLEEYHFTNNENSTVIISVIEKKDFNAQTKVGSFTLKDGCWVEDNSREKRDLDEEKYGDHYAYFVGASTMSDPAHKEYAVVTNGNYILVVKGFFADNDHESAIKDVISSIVFKNNLSSIQIDCK